jgi:hypothetical protein
MWGITEMYHTHNLEGFYDEATDSMFNRLENPSQVTLFSEFITYGLYGEKPGRRGPADEEWQRKKHAEYLARVQSENEQKYNARIGDARRQLDPAREARKIVLCKEFLDNLPNLLWNRAREPEGWGEMFRKKLLNDLKRELKRAKKARGLGG